MSDSSMYPFHSKPARSRSLSVTLCTGDHSPPSQCPGVTAHITSRCQLDQSHAIQMRFQDMEFPNPQSPLYEISLLFSDNPFPPPAIGFGPFFLRQSSSLLRYFKFSVLIFCASLLCACSDVHEEAFEASHDDNEGEEHVDVPDIQEEDVGGFPGGPRDASLLTHYVQHVAYGISHGRSWIYEHFPTMGRRRLVSSYDETTPRAARWQSPRQSSTLAEIRSQLDGLTYSGVVWHPYEGHRGIRPFFGIYADVVAVDYAWLHFMNHVIMNGRQASYPYECVDGYIQWFRRVSHPYIIPAPPNARPALAPTQRPDVGITVG
ncbi:hypothetical protein LR48_Vigan10g217400 [Vigna angularis]|uniref:Aminotransferase-like plant mobile domain-containing protein n=1 Tax=Phaseolus angularis TaxID=3914 RepID=A0A0L9VN04_PHAAN|nr:hypothetical protein LR48_Vigan10g217400 [Vigna angularis]